MSADPRRVASPSGTGGTAATWVVFGSWNFSWSVGDGGTTEQWPPPETVTK